MMAKMTIVCDDDDDDDDDNINNLFTSQFYSH